MPVVRDKVQGVNDASWYTHNPSLVAPVASVPFPYRPGMTMPISGDETIATNPPIPGIVQIDWVPSFGVSATTSSPISQAAFDIYTRVRAVYSGALEVDAPDFIIYLGAIDSIFSYIAWLKRLYRAISTYSPENYSIPTAFMQAMNAYWTSTDFVSNKMNLLQGINELILAMGTYKCPAVMDLMNRHYWMSDNVYADAPSARAQLYMFNLLAVYKIDEVPLADTSGNSSTGLKMTVVPPATSVQTVLNFGWTLVNALRSWDDALTISGYLTRAYDGIPNFSIALLDPYATLEAVYEPEVLTQIENLETMFTGVRTFVNSAAQFTDWVVTQNPLTNAVVTRCKLQCAGDANLSALRPVSTHLLNFHIDNPTPEQVLVATRLKATFSFTPPGTGETKATIQAKGGTEIVIGMQIHSPARQEDGATALHNVVANTYMVLSGMSASALNGFLLLSQFDWHPILLMQSAASQVVIPYGDIYNPAFLTQAELDNMNRVCLYSELNAFNL